MGKRADHERLAEWFRRFQRWRAPLRKLLISRGWSVRSQDLDDVAQEVFLRLLRYGNAELIEHPQAYLLRMAANVAGEWALLARHRQPHHDAWLSELPDPEESVERQLARDQAHRRFRASLDELPLRQREVVRLHFGEGLTRGQIAQRLQVSERVVKRDLIHAYTALRTPGNAEVAQILNEPGGSYGQD